MTETTAAPVRTTEPVRLFERGQDYLELVPETDGRLAVVIFNAYASPLNRVACRGLDRDQAVRLAEELYAWAVGVPPPPEEP